MAAPPEKVWELVSDVTRIGEFSPETFEAEWLDGATGPAVGAKFRGHVKRNGKGPIYWVTCTVMVSEPGREFTFGTAGKTGTAERMELPARAQRRRHRCHRVVHAREQAVAPRVLGGARLGARARRTATGMRTTLERIKAVVE
jgi:uncharacterized protein YndB with AHSA1/START domain